MSAENQVRVPTTTGRDVIFELDGGQVKVICPLSLRTPRVHLDDLYTAFSALRMLEGGAVRHGARRDTPA